MAKREDKTNVMRLLEQAGVSYQAHSYASPDGATDGVTIARLTGREPERVFKTLVARGASGGLYVFDIPVAETLDLKKGAKAVGEKSVAMLPQRELLPLTGYVHGGCSPIGMKKRYLTVLDETAQLFDTILVSGGRIGTQVELEPTALAELVGGHFADLTV